jgi:hypothetical protein
MAIFQIPPLIDRGSGVFASQSWKWLTERLAYLPQVCLVFDEELPQLAASSENFEDSLRCYGALLLTMIKIVLIATISFASPSQ